MSTARRWGAGRGFVWKFCPAPLTFLRLGSFAPKLKRFDRFPVIGRTMEQIRGKSVGNNEV